MTEEYFEKFLRTYKLLTTQNSSKNKNYFDGYIVYSKTDIENVKPIFDFIQQFQGIPFSAFHKEEHIKSFPVPEKYFGTATVIIDEHHVKFHYDLSLVLFFYLCHILRPDLEKLILILNSQDYDMKFGNVTNTDKYSVKYLLSYHEKIYAYLKNHVENYKLIYVLFHHCNSHIMIVDENRMSIRVPRILDILNGLDSQYNFKDYEIE